MKSPPTIASASRSLGTINKIWLGLTILVPIIPKAAVFHLGSVAVLLDDLVLVSALLLGFSVILISAIVHGIGELSVSKAGAIFLILITYKTANFLSLSLVFPWGDLSSRGSALLFNEGLLVLARTTASAGVYLLFFHFIRSWEDVYFVLRLYVITILVVMIIGLLQHFVLDEPIMTSTFRNLHAISQGEWKVDNPWLGGTSTGHEHLGAFMLFAISIFCGCYVYRWPTSRRHRKIISILLLMGIYVLLMASSRGAWVGALCSGAAFVWFAIRDRKFIYLNRLILWLILGLGVLYIAGFDFVGLIERRVSQLVTVFDDEVLDDSANHRLGLMKFLWQMFLEQPILGWGAGGAGRIAEGQYLRELVEGGLIGGLLFLSLMAITAKIAMHTIKIAKTPQTQGLGLGFLCGLVGLMGHSMFTELFVLPKVIVPFWVMAAIVHRMYFLKRSSSANGASTN